MPKNDCLKIESILGESLPAIKALKFFTKTTRGGKRREIYRMVQFVKDVSDVDIYNDDEIAEWIRNLWCGGWQEYFDGNPTEYIKNLKNIPPSLMDKCRFYAKIIARGSGRKPINQEWLKRIELEFSNNPVVMKPIRNDIEDNISLEFTIKLNDEI